MFNGEFMEKIEFLSLAQLKSEADRCLYCEEKPCKEACPVDCSPADFIMAVKNLKNSDFKRSAKIIMGSNPLGGVCGAVCPDWFCVKACSRKLFDKPIEIPSVQATIIQKARELNVMPKFDKAEKNGKKIAIIGSGPAGLSAGAVMAQLGYEVDIYEKEKKLGGAINLIPDERLPKNVLSKDIEFIKSLGEIKFISKEIKDPKSLLSKYDAVIVSAGVDKQIRLNIKNEDKGIDGLLFLKDIKKYKLKNRRVAVIGGGAVAADCAMQALRNGALKAEIFTRKNIGDIQLPKKELADIIYRGININGRSRIAEIVFDKGKIKGIKIVRLDEKSRDIPETIQFRSDFDFVVLAIKNIPSMENKEIKGVFYAGDLKNGASTVVECAASGKNAALEADAYLNSKKIDIEKNTKSRCVLKGKNMSPVNLSTDFFQIKLSSPFLISAAPHSDGYEQVKMAYQAGWPGVIMKTAFDGIHIHIPGEYMFRFNDSTYGNSDNVSGHPLDRVCGEIRRLRKEFPDRLTGASTGGPVTGNDEEDKKVWQKNTLKLEQAGAMVIEYSLSCPQGGDGTKGDIVSQDQELSAKIVDWVMQVSNPDIPKLFKLTGAVTSIYQIVDAIKKVYDRYPHKKAGITLANSFPALAFRKSANPRKIWDEGVVIGMSGEGVLPISNLTIAKASKIDIVISGNGGAMDYLGAANFLAMGAHTVQFCTAVMKYGYGIINELNSGLSHMLEEKGFKSVKDFIGCAKPDIITNFIELSDKKKIPEVDKNLCAHCGNCSYCGYLAVELDKDGIPHFDPSKCVGCSICVQKCFTGALKMRERSKAEKEALKED
jgi:NADPH-dependent glutamate synthase beta subunit-like oxidoreductase/dihydroorotate dehydrogenase/Pyruvate/2-oxoacid:ferredoxin oxidoreductase delta subunit